MGGCDVRLISVWVMFLGAVLLSAFADSGPRVEPLGGNLYAYISDNDGSANSTFLIGPSGILVVDCGIDAIEGGKILREIRKISPLPVAYIVNTHYHPDHQGGNGVVGPDATVISSPFTREKTIAVAEAMSKPDPSHPSPATNSSFVRPQSR